MSKPTKRKCPACGEVKEFRQDQKTCGCKGLAPQLPTTEFDDRVKKLLLGKNLTLVQLADRLNCAPKLAKDAVDRLHTAGHNVRLVYDQITVGTEIQPGSKLVVDSSDFFNGEDYVFGVLGDTHLYSKYARTDVLSCLYDIYEKEKITTVFHTGNIVDGECRFNKFDLIGPSGIGPQAEYLAKEYPVREGIVTKFITGDDHEGWWIQREGLNVGKYLQDAAEDTGREDLKFIGHVEVDIILKQAEGQSVIRLSHPGGGTSYAISYKAQKAVESYQGGEKPQILFQGHYHKYNVGYPREVYTVDTGCVQDQTPFMRKNHLQAHLGGCIVRFHQAPTGEINRFSVEFIPFYDKHFYEKNDKYRRW
jgi:hypothetical protein